MTFCVYFAGFLWILVCSEWIPVRFERNLFSFSKTLFSFKWILDSFEWIHRCSQIMLLLQKYRFPRLTVVSL